MRLATLQFSPVLGDVDASIRRADELLRRDAALLVGTGLLVLPELAFTGVYVVNVI